MKMLSMMRRQFVRKSKQQTEVTEPESESQKSVPDPEQAWKALSLVNDWIRHAEAKATAMLAATGVTGGILYSLVHAQTHPSLALDVVATVNGLMIISAGGSAVIALVPRLTVPKVKKVVAATSLVPQAATVAASEDPVNLLYFRDIARRYRGDAPTYTQVLTTLTTDPTKLTEHIGRQVHANSDVAHRKYGWANRAAVGLAADLVMLGATAILVAHY